jgi:pyridoxal phosphate enzyme (YggS family)
MPDDIADTLEQRLRQVAARVRAAEQRFGRAPGSVLLLPVSKTQPAEAIARVAAAGYCAFGESYLQEALAKMETLAALDLQWHFIGPIQSNKTQAIARYFQWVHSVDRDKIARRLDEQRPADLPPLNVCLQVNIGGETSKSGVTLAELPALAASCAGYPRLRLRGLMAIPVRSEDFASQRAAFRQLRLARDELNAAGFALDTLSMGMSGDLEAAIAEGATLVRVGTDIFGARRTA